MSYQDLTTSKDDCRPKRHGWAPGGYFNMCMLCGDRFIGDKRACMCADCAYKEPLAPQNEKEGAHD